MLDYNKNLKSYSQTLRKNMTKSESRLGSRLKGKQLNQVQFYRQKIIGNYIVDFYCPKASLVIELDGGQHYSEAGRNKDKQRDNYLQTQGLHIMRYSDREVFENLEGIINHIQNHLVRFVSEIVSQMDLTALKAVYAGRGSSAYHPEMLLSLLIYGYATGVFSSRKLEQSTYDSVTFRYLAANTHPDHDTIANFRKRFLPELEALFVQVLMLAHGMKLLKLGKISLDGTKIHANASKHHALSWKHANKIEEQLQAEVKRLLEMAEETDRADIPDEMSIPEELSRREDQLTAIAKAKAEIQRRAKEREDKALETGKRKKSEKASNRKAGSEKNADYKSVPLKEVEPLAKDQVNLTDTESRIMHVSGGGFEQSYNAQSGVDMKTMLIVTNHVTQAGNDKEQLESTLTELSSLPQELGRPKALVADSGYYSQKNIELCEAEKVVPYITEGRERHHPTLESRFSVAPALRANADAKEKQRRRLKTRFGRKLYARRKSTVEPVFGIIKSVLGFRQFLLRGLQGVQGEWKLVCLAWNFKRMYVLKATAS